MKKYIISLLSTVTFLFSAFDDPVTGLDSLSLGNAKASIRSVSAVNINPGITCFLDKLTIGGLSQIQSSFADEGFGYGVILYTGIPVNSKIGINGGINYYGFGGVDYPNVNKLSAYNEYIITAGAGYKIINNVSVGLSLKYQAWNLNAEKKQTGLNGANFNLTTGLYINKIFNTISIGISVDNVLPGNASSDNGDADKIPLTIIAGSLFEFGIFEIVTEMNYDADKNYGINTGCKIKLLNNKLALLAGSELSDEFKNITITSGVQYKIGFIDIKYAFQYPLTFSGSLGYHYLGAEFKL